MSFGPPRRGAARSHRPLSAGKASAHEIDKKQEKLRLLANDRQKAWAIRRECGSASAAVPLFQPPTQHVTSNSNESAVRNRQEQRMAWGSNLSNVDDFPSVVCPGPLEPQAVLPERHNLNLIADASVKAAKAAIHHFGRVDRPESHFCRVCRKLMSLTGHNAMCLIPCAHTLCESCATSSLERCPVCGLAVKTTTFNVLLQKIIDRFSDEHGLVPKQSQIRYDDGPERPKVPLEEIRDVADYVPNPDTINRWAEQLASVEMRISVMDVQARQLSKELLTYKTRYQGVLSDVRKCEAEEERLMNEIAVLSEQLEVVRSQKEQWMDGVRSERANEEKLREQLNLTNYTKAGLEAELEKLRLLCNRKS